MKNVPFCGSPTAPKKDPFGELRGKLSIEFNEPVEVDKIPCYDWGIYRAGELKGANGNYKIAFERYETVFKPFIDRKQKIAQNYLQIALRCSGSNAYLHSAFVKFSSRKLGNGF